MVTRSEIEGFSVAELCDFIAQNLAHVEDSTEIQRELELNKITGKAFLELTDEDLREMIRPIGDRKALKSLAKSYQPQPVVCKIYTYQSVVFVHLLSMLWWLLT